MQKFFLLCATLFFLTPSPRLKANSPFEYELAICTMFQNDAEWLEEWIEYYLLLGAGHFYLYNNQSTDDYLEVLAPYIERGVVEVIDWPNWEPIPPFWSNYQIPAFQDCLQRARGVARWLAIIDTDEFIVLHHHETLPEFLENYAHAGSVSINWQCFGTSGYKCIPENQLLIECLTRKSPTTNSGKVKSINQPLHCLAVSGAHRIGWFEPGYREVRPDGTGEVVQTEQVQINHYCVRTEDWFWNVKFPRDSRTSSRRELYFRASTERWLGTLNEVEDLSIQRFVPALKRRMRNRQHIH